MLSKRQRRTRKIKEIIENEIRRLVKITKSKQSWHQNKDKSIKNKNAKEYRIS